MLIVITGLDGSGTSSIAKELHDMDKGSMLVRTPSIEYFREKIDTNVREVSPLAHYYFYLSSVIYMSDYIKNNFDYKEKNVYCVKYLIDTVVSHQEAGLNVDLDYEKYGILKPDLTVFVQLDEQVRKERIVKRGDLSVFDRMLQDNSTRNRILDRFKLLLDDDTIYFNNLNQDLKKNAKELYREIAKANLLQK